MALTINTNIASINAQRNLSKSGAALNTSLQRLSSGLRINSAKDDAAGLAISNAFTSQIRGLSQAVRNANDGISVAQVAEGAMSEITNSLQRIRELAIQASNSNLTSSDRSKLNVEVTELVDEIQRIATTTNFNGAKLLDGTFGTGTFQVGTDAGQNVSLAIGDVTTSALGNTASATTSGAYALAKVTSSTNSLVTAAGVTSLAANDLTINGTSIRAAKSGDDTSSTVDVAASALSLAAAINASSDDTGVSAFANATTVDMGTVTFSTGTGIGASDFQINGTSVTTGNGVSTIAVFVNAINEQSATTGVVAQNTGNELTLIAVDGRNVRLTTDGSLASLTTSALTLTTADDDVMVGTVTLYSNEEIVVAGSDPSVSGLSALTTSATSETLLQTANGASTYEALSTGDVTINGYAIDFAAIATTASNEQSLTDASNSAQFIALQINNTTGLKSEVSASAVTIANLGTVSASAATAAHDIIVNGVTATIASGVLANDDNGYLVGEFNNIFGAQTSNHDAFGIVASLNSSNELILTADDGRNITIDVGTVSGTDYLSGLDMTTTASDVVAKGTVSLAAKDGFTINSIDGDKLALAGIESAVGTIERVTVATAEGAQNALTAVDTALSQVDTLRATLGAVQNRLTSTITNIENVIENFSGARSRILDADFANETAALTKNQILQQAGVSILSQANSLPQAVLALLQ